MDLLVRLGNGTCWGALVVVWVVGAAYNVRHAPPRHERQRPEYALIAFSVVGAAVVALAIEAVADHLVVDATCVRVAGLAVLLASTVFAIWARVALGTMWTVDAVVKDHHELRTTGPYAVTRHPIYTGMLGMLAGSCALSGFGQWTLLVPVGLIVFGAKVHAEERLMQATFPGAYADFRADVPQLVPGLRAIARRRRPSRDRS